jgi:hypothetical protein
LIEFKIDLNLGLNPEIEKDLENPKHFLGQFSSLGPLPFPWLGPVVSVGLFPFSSPAWPVFIPTCVRQPSSQSTSPLSRQSNRLNTVGPGKPELILNITHSWKGNSPFLIPPWNSGFEVPFDIKQVHVHVGHKIKPIFI